MTLFFFGHPIQITVKECCNEDAQCAFVVDKILEISSEGSSDKCTFGNVAVLYRRQVKHTFHLILSFHKKALKILLNLLWLHLLYLRCLGKCSKQLFVTGKYHSTFTEWPSIEKRLLTPFMFINGRAVL